METNQVLARIRALAPEQYAADWDNSRVQIAGVRRDIARLAVTLDPKPAIMAECLSWGADLVLTHHPLYFQPQAPTGAGQYQEVLRQFMGAGAWLYSAHTSLDCRPDGPAFWLGRALGLQDCRSIELSRSLPAREVVFKAPSKFTEREARPLLDTPGVHSLSQSGAGEVRVVCDEAAWNDVREAFRFIFADRPLDFAVRRLEEPALRVGFGQLGELPKDMDFEAFARLLEQALFSVQKPQAVSGGGKGLAWAECGPRPGKIRRVGYTTGSGASLIPAVFAAGADVFVCGDVKHHAAQETPGLVLDIGHFILEEEMMRLFAQELQQDLGRGAEVRFFAGTSPFSYRVLA